MFFLVKYCNKAGFLLKKWYFDMAERRVNVYIKYVANLKWSAVGLAVAAAAIMGYVIGNYW